jgi:hypothetical protein
VPDGEGGFLEPIQVEIRGVDGAVRADDSQSLIELSLADAVGNISLTGTLVRQVNNGVATFDDLGINAESAGEFILRASLSGDETLAITGFSLGTLQVEQRRIAAGLATRSAVTGVAFSGTVSGITNSPSFASDLRLSVTAPDGTSASLGGFETSSNQPWAFAGEGSGTDGRYESEHPALFSGQAAPLSDEGFWRFEFRNDFSGGELMSWSDVQITLIKQPIEVVSGTIPVQGSRIFQDRFELD